MQTLVLQRAEFQRLRRSYTSVDRLLVDYLAAQVVVLTLLAAPGRHSKPPAVCMRHSSVRLSACPG